ncbi:MAG TPA: hypothetical protein VHL54_03230 [Actinomycetota bacterium]|nr:hypothetical protein [Actinomycetota bacterium]
MKLPKARVDELESSGAATRLVIGAKQMAEWAVIGRPAGGAGAGGLLRESADFVSPTPP